MHRRLLPLAYAYMVLQGLLAVVLPKRAIDLNARLTLQGFENPGDLVPTDSVYCSCLPVRPPEPGRSIPK